MRSWSRDSNRDGTYTGVIRISWILWERLSALTTIKNLSDHNRQDIIHSKNREYTQLCEHNNTISLVWVPSHIGLPGNEKADQAAKIGLTHKHKINTTYSKTKIKSLINVIINYKYNKKYQENWNHTDYYKIQPNKVNKVRNFHHFRKVDTTITRLRLNNARNNTYLHKIGKKPNNLCNYCNTPDTIQHNIYECKQYYKHRAELLSNTNQVSQFNTLLSNSKHYPHLARYLIKSKLCYII